MQAVGLLLLAMLGGGAGEAAGEGQGPDATGAKVLAFARSKIGETIGDGQCAALVIAALEDAGAGRPRGPGQWGEPLEALDDARPGDILEFEEARFAGRRVNPNRTITTWSYHFPRHTAIVSAVGRRRGAVMFRVIHQNARIRGRDESAAVKEWTIDMAALRSGTVRAYRAVAAGLGRVEGPAGPEPADVGEEGR